MSGPNLHEWQRAKLQGMGELPSTTTPHPTLFFGGELKGSCDAHDCSSLSRQGSVANEGLWVSTRHFTLSASLTTPPCSPCTPTPPPPLFLQIPNRTGLIGLAGNLGCTPCFLINKCTNLPMHLSNPCFGLPRLCPPLSPRQMWYNGATLILSCSNCTY